jgi:hypothetical protein
MSQRRTLEILNRLETGERPINIARSLGCSVANVHRVIKQSGLDRCPAQSGPVRGCDEVVISPLAKKIARRFYRWRQVDNDFGFREAGNIIGVTRQRASGIEAGTYPITLPELERLAAALNVSPSQLLA